MPDTKKMEELFGSNVFTDSAMKERLPKPAYQALRKTIDQGASLDPWVAEVVAGAMKDWAVEKGATHFTHWFQPLTGFTAEKHDSFISPTSNGKILLEFSGKELIRGEPDASSFPSGGLRSTFEARGYTAWDCTSPAFLKDRALCIPTAFVSYTGETLDKKMPLLRSMDALSKQALRILRLFGNTTATKVTTTVGPEQEYFLIDKAMYDRRKDLILTGHTLFGAKPAKGQELEDHYFGQIKERISDFMEELNEELWRLGILSKTQHNEVAPAQHELAPIYSSTNIATDHNQLVMAYMQKVALRHGLVCLLHEKPFAGINGSGKHNNWSMGTSDGQNLLEPGNTPHDNLQFLVFLMAVIAAVDDYADLLRMSAATPGNDHRLGANEAPPAIISIFLGEQLTDILAQLENGGATKSKQGGTLNLGASTLPPLPKDNTDRNRTSPFAFTGNKFEFRMVGSSSSIAMPNFILNAIVAETLSLFADRLEKAKDFDAEVKALVKDMARAHKKVIFNGNNYTEEWVAEAEKRGLPNIRSTVAATQALKNPKNVALMKKHNVLSKAEMESRCEIMLEGYIKTIRIEALTMLEMAKRQILPAAVTYISELAGSIQGVKAAALDADTDAQASTLKEASTAAASFKKNIALLESKLGEADGLHGDTYQQACAFRDSVFAQMALLREDGDKLESIVSAAVWPFPTYSDILFNI
jgi:glutamine synthetase